MKLTDGGVLRSLLPPLTLDEAYVIVKDIYNTTIFTEKGFLASQSQKIEVETVYNYLSKLENAYILNRCSRQELQGREILKTQEKFYLADNAFEHAALGYKQDDISQTLKNIVYLELRRREYDVYVGKLGAKEIDFVAEKQGKSIYVQVASLLADKKHRNGSLGICSK
ncbi:MAG: hypothetical protein K0S60_404 [Evtepia sp.]|jgi:predicted AAA+ superfamily ATPase|nr:hypothetical protein [Evtepia sp.]